jgi:hypothetical protein
VAANERAHGVRCARVLNDDISAALDKAYPFDGQRSTVLDGVRREEIDAMAGCIVLTGNKT